MSCSKTIDIDLIAVGIYKLLSAVELMTGIGYWDVIMGRKKLVGKLLCEIGFLCTAVGNVYFLLDENYNAQMLLTYIMVSIKWEK